MGPDGEVLFRLLLPFSEASLVNRTGKKMLRSVSHVTA